MTTIEACLLPAGFVAALPVGAVVMGIEVDSCAVKGTVLLYCDIGVDRESWTEGCPSRYEFQVKGEHVLRGGSD
jgi:hypothetical protein